MTAAEIGAISTLGLAHIGDGVYELMTRTYLVESGVTTVEKLHKKTVARVCAPAQALAAQKIAPLLTDAEHDIYKRGRNARVNSVPKGADTAQYHASTGLETLFGWLYLRGENDRLRELFNGITEESNAT
ncbi:MAG: ribonuclease III domain-containing protein [Oscillospiraceae bacterium]